MTVEKLLVSSGSFDANLTAAGVTAAGLHWEKRLAGEFRLACLPSLLSSSLHYRIRNQRKDNPDFYSFFGGFSGLLHINRIQDHFGLISFQFCIPALFWFYSPAPFTNRIFPQQCSATSSSFLCIQAAPACYIPCGFLRHLISQC